MLPNKLSKSSASYSQNNNLLYAVLNAHILI